MVQSATPYVAGIDVSHYQGEVDWNAVAGAGVRFAIVKATEGIGDLDPRFHDNWQGARSAGLLRGAYHFLHPNEDARQQAQHFLSVVTMDEDALPPALDIEVTGGVDVAGLRLAIEGWIENVEPAVGCKPILYTDPSFWREHVAADFSAYPLWLACYSDEPEVPPDWTAWTFWQHTQAGRIAGVGGAVDLDRFASSLDRLQALCPARGG